MKRNTLTRRGVCLASLIGAGVMVAMGGAASATSITIQNPSFEVPAITSDNTAVTAPRSSSAANGLFNGWGYYEQTSTSPGSFYDFGFENPGGEEYTNATGSGTPLGADGTNVAWLNQSVAGNVTNMFQDVGGLSPNTTYTLTVAIGQRMDRVNGPVQIGLINASSSDTNPWADGTLLSSTTGVSTVAGSFQDFSTTFSTGSAVSGDLYVGAQFTDQVVGGTNLIQGSVDNFRLDASAVPEPASWMLLLAASAGGMLLLSRRRFRRD
jgi:hypothetical protein